MGMNEKLILRKLWLSIGFILMLAIIGINLILDPAKYAELDELRKCLSDKAVHFITYALLMGWFIQIYHTKKSRLIMGVLFILSGVIIEYLQGLDQARQFDVEDMIANGLGVLFSWVLGKTGFANILLWFERRALKL